MDINKACDTLHLSLPFNIDDLRKQYYKLALKYHPDRNQNKNATLEFQEILDSYNFLKLYIDSEKQYDDNKNDYKNDSTFNTIINNLINVISYSNNNICKNVINKILSAIDKDFAFNILLFIKQNNHFLNIDENIVTYITDVVKSKYNNDVLYIVNPNINNLLNEEVYILEIEDETLYVPLWHSEVIYDLKKSSIVIKCIPDLDENVSIDHNNNIHVNILRNIKNILFENFIKIPFGPKELEIPIKELNIKKNQIYVLKEQGIPIIDTNDIFSNSKKGDIIIHLELY